MTVEYAKRMLDDLYGTRLTNQTVPYNYLTHHRKNHAIKT
jgi:hypothetical protein